MPLVAGIDSSTQSCKVIIVDVATSTIVREGRASHPYGSEIAPELWWDALQEAISQAGGLTDVAAWSIGAQQHGLVAIDSAGDVIRPALLWNDVRSASSARDLIRELGADTFARRTGTVPVASFTVTKLRWMRDNEPDLARRIAAVALPHDWLTWRMRGYGPTGVLGVNFDALTTDRSDASGTGYWSSHSGYDEEIFGAALGHDAIRPRVLGPSGALLDVTGRHVGVGAGDNAAAALGLGMGTGDVAVSIGTSGTVFAVSDTPTYDATGTVAGFAAADGGFLPLTATLNAAKILDATMQLLKVGPDEFSHLAMSAPSGSLGLRLTPYFEGERTPNLPDATGTLDGITLASFRRENLARAAVEGMLGGLLYGMDAIASRGVSLARAILIGGAACSVAVRAVAADLFPVPIVFPPPSEYVAWGAARQAASVLGTTLPGATANVAD